MVEVERIELSSKRLPRKALQLVETITPPKGQRLVAGHAKGSEGNRTLLAFPIAYTLSFTSDSALLKETVSDRAEGGKGACCSARDPLPDITQLAPCVAL